MNIAISKQAKGMNEMHQILYQCHGVYMVRFSGQYLVLADYDGERYTTHNTYQEPLPAWINWITIVEQRGIRRIAMRKSDV